MFEDDSCATFSVCYPVVALFKSNNTILIISKGSGMEAYKIAFDLHRDRPFTGRQASITHPSQDEPFYQGDLRNMPLEWLNYIRRNDLLTYSKLLHEWFRDQAELSRITPHSWRNLVDVT
jgi:hypothetical protein